MILNSCHNLSSYLDFEDVGVQKVGVFPNKESVNLDNNGIKWFIATKGAAILGWGEVNISYNGINTVYGTLDAGSKGRSPNDKQGSTEWTANVMKTFWTSVQDFEKSNSRLPDDNEYAKLWVDAVRTNLPSTPIESMKNAVGIGKNKNGIIELYAINCNANPVKVEKAWYCNCPF